MARPDEPGGARPRWLLGLVLVVVSLGLVVGWADRSGVESVDVGTTERLFVVNSGGPITVVAGPTSRVMSTNSWMVRAPTIETARDGSAMVVRVGCPGVTPCRTSVEVQIASVASLTVLSDESVTVTDYDGELTILAGTMASIGPISGSGRVVTEGRIEGFALAVDELDASTVDGPVDLDFELAPTAVVVEGSAAPVVVRLPDTDYRFDIESATDDIDLVVPSVEDADRIIQLRSRGSVRVTAREP